MDSRSALAHLLGQKWSAGRVYWLSCNREQVDLAFESITNTGDELLTLEVDLRKGAMALMWDFLALLEGLPQGLTLAEIDLEPLLLELAGSLNEKFQRRTLLVRLATNSSVEKDQTEESLAVLRLATTVLANTLCFVILDSVGEVQDYERMGVIADLQRFSPEVPANLDAGPLATGEALANNRDDSSWDIPRFDESDDVDVYRVSFDSAEVEISLREQRSRAAVELSADVILIAHPESQRLGARFRLSPGATLEVGRAASAGISLPEVMWVSRKHARLRYSGRIVTLEDLGSKNATYINGHRAHGRVALRSGDRFQTANVHFQFFHEEDAEGVYNRALHELMERDGLTGVATRWKFDHELQLEFARAVYHRRPLSLVIFGVDELKSINTAYGRICADFVLAQVASNSQVLVRSEQILARVGADTFAILAPEVDIEQAETLAHGLRKIISGYEHQYGEIGLSISCSFGVAELTGKMSTPRDLYDAANGALLRAKRRGPCQVMIAP